MTSTAELTSHRLDQVYQGDRIKTAPLPALDLNSMNGQQDVNASFAHARSGCRWMLPHNQDRWAREQASARANRFDWRRNAAHREAYSNLIRESTERTPRGLEKRLELNAYREFELLNEMVAIPFAMGPFQSINLSADEMPLLTFPKARQYFNVRFIGQDGGPRQDQWRDDKTIEQIDLRMVSTDRIEFPLFDLRQGRVNPLARINDQLRFDMEMKIDSLALAEIDAAKTTSGLRDLLNLHPRIVQANVPDTNYLNLNGVGSSPGVLTIEKWKRILAHINSFGPGIDPDRSIQINAVIMSPQNMRDQWDFIDLVSGFSGVGTVQPADTVLTSVREEIFNTGVLQHAWGYTWTAQFNGMLPKGKMYIFTNQPLGWFFTKTEFDQLFIWDGPDQQEMNFGQVQWRRAFNFVVPDLWKHRIVIVDL